MDGAQTNSVDLPGAAVNLYHARPHHGPIEPPDSPAEHGTNPSILHKTRQTLRRGTVVGEDGGARAGCVGFNREVRV